MKQRLGLASQATFVVFTLLIGASASAATRAIPVDGLGRPVLDDAGNRIRYPAPPAPELDRGPARRLALAAEAADVVDPQLLSRDTVVGTLAYTLGTAGISALDVDRDGLAEVLVGNYDRVCLLGWDAQAAGYTVRWFADDAELSAGSVRRIARAVMGDVGAGGPKVVILNEDSQLYYLDALTGEILTSHSLPRANIDFDLALADVDVSPGLEVIAVTGKELAAYAYPSAQPLWSTSAVTGDHVAVGQMDGDPGLEIVVVKSTVSASYIFDVATRTIQWTTNPGLGERVAAGDIDGDGRDEVVVIAGSSRCVAYDVEVQAEKWSVSTPIGGTEAVRVADVTGDGVGEVILGDAQWGDVHAHDGASGSQLWSIANPQHGVSDIAVTDADGDCSLDVIWGAGWTSSGEDRLYVADIAAATIKWENVEADGPWNCVAVGDVDGDGRSELLRVSSQTDSGYGGALVYVTDLHHRRDEYRAPNALSYVNNRTNGVALAQLDGDAPLEYVIADVDGTNKVVRAFDGATHAVQWTSAASAVPSSLAAGDVDRNGSNEIMLGAENGVLYQINGATGATQWQNAMAVGSPVVGVRVADVDGDGANEIVVATEGDGMRVFDGSTHVPEWSGALATIECLDIGDVDGDGDLDIVAGTYDGRVAAWDGGSKVPLFTTTVAAGSRDVYAVRVGRVDGDGRAEVVFGCEVVGGSHVGVLDTSTMAILWMSPDLLGNAGEYDSLFVGDADDDGKTEIVVGTGSSVHVYEYDTNPSDTQPPAWAGAVGVQTVAAIGASSCCPALDVSWGMANDDRNPPITYLVYRDTNPGFTPSPSTLVASVRALSYRDTGLQLGNTYYYIVRAADEVGNVESNAVRASGYPGGLSILPPSLPGGTVGTAYSQALSASGGVGPYTFSVTGGALPIGLVLSAAGVISGTPTVAGTFGFTLTARDTQSCAGVATLAISIDDPAGGAAENLVLGMGLGAPNENRVRVFRQDGTASGVDFLAYGAGSWGVVVATGDIGSGNGAAHVVTGPGPGAIYGPHVRAFFRTGSAISKVSYYAYGTLKFGVNVGAGLLDADGYDELVTGAGSGAVFGPHVRAWNFDGAAIAAIAKVNFFAYGTLKYGVSAVSGSIDGDPFAEVLTGPGPGAIFGPQVRGFNYDGVSVASLAKVNFNAFATSQYGVNVAGGDVDGDGYEEIAATPGPGQGASFPSRFLAFDFDGVSIGGLPGFDVTIPAATSYGGRVGLGDVTGDGSANLLAGAGRDPSASATVRPYVYLGGAVTPLLTFDPFPGSGYGVNPAGGALGY